VAPDFSDLGHARYLLRFDRALVDGLRVADEYAAVVGTDIQYLRSIFTRTRRKEYIYSVSSKRVDKRSRLVARRRQSETLSRFHGDHAFLAFSHRLDVQSVISSLIVLVAIERHLHNPNDGIG